jgi:hypothetical protein
VQISLGGSYHDDENNEVFTGCCYPYKRLVALDESHFRQSGCSSSTGGTNTTTAFDLFYITTELQDEHHNNYSSSNSNKMIVVHQLALVPTATNCRDWPFWTFLGECQTCMLRLHIAMYLKKQQQRQQQQQSILMVHNDASSHHYGRRSDDHWHMEAFIDRVLIPKHPPHWLAHHPNLHQCSKSHHLKLTMRAAFRDLRNTASSSQQRRQQQQQQQQQLRRPPKHHDNGEKVLTKDRFMIQQRQSTPDVVDKGGNEIRAVGRQSSGRKKSTS